MNRGPAANDPEDVVTGIFLRIGMGLSFSAMAALLKLASTGGLNAAELVFYRSLFALPVVLAWVLKRESLDVLKPNNPIAHVWRSGLGLLSMGLTFQALIPPAFGRCDGDQFHCAGESARPRLQCRQFEQQ